MRMDFLGSDSYTILLLIFLTFIGAFLIWMIRFRTANAKKIEKVDLEKRQIIEQLQKGDDNPDKQEI